MQTCRFEFFCPTEVKYFTFAKWIWNHILKLNENYKKDDSETQWGAAVDLPASFLVLSWAGICLIHSLVTPSDAQDFQHHPLSILYHINKTTQHLPPLNFNVLTDIG